jgi:hypothetical protein
LPSLPLSQIIITPMLFTVFPVEPLFVFRR